MEVKHEAILKTVKRGFKVWVRVDAVTGYVCEFEVYTGKSDGQPELGLGGNVVKRLTRNITGHNYNNSLLRQLFHQCCSLPRPTL